MNNQEDTLSEIKKKVGGKKDEQILLVTQHTEPLMKYSSSPQDLFPPQRRDELTITRKFFRLGIFDNTSFSDKEVIFNMPYHVEKNPSYEDYWKRVEGNINFYSYSLLSVLGENAFLHIGNKEVEEYFRDKRNLMENLDITKESSFDDKCYKKIPEFSYVRALHLLGADAPKDFEEGYIKNCLGEAISLYKDINEIEGKTGALEKRIESIKEACKKGELDQGFKDIAFWDGTIKRVEENRDKVISYLSSALKNGLHEYDLNFRLQPGIMIDVKEYVLGLCKEYSVDIPEELCMLKK